MFCFCSMFGDAMRRHLSVSVIDADRSVDLLNGSKWDDLYVRLQKILVSEFNQRYTLWKFSIKYLSVYQKLYKFARTK